ncbi:hypothetical protein M413DRAFT_135480 [Hebeloma cylindrosporum]|uniref:Uncharacterized protein n=1 Tax=Hebeloma cylindrosporum TaxID=76867 RepID=A0A0C3BCX6_HEBCY|nr:hypothetical protein M413DRAFT_135480 [Hebeloma cylindrosporum h7]
MWGGCSWNDIWMGGRALTTWSLLLPYHRTPPSRRTSKPSWSGLRHHKHTSPYFPLSNFPSFMDQCSTISLIRGWSQ